MDDLDEIFTDLDFSGLALTGGRPFRGCVPLVLLVITLIVIGAAVWHFNKVSVEEQQISEQTE